MEHALEERKLFYYSSAHESFMDVDSVPTICHLIEEVPNFKAFIEDSLLDGDKALVGDTKVQQFKFYLNSVGVPIMKYKRYCMDSDWLSEKGRIKLWKEDSEGQNLWPVGSLCMLPTFQCAVWRTSPRAYRDSLNIGGTIQQRWER